MNPRGSQSYGERFSRAWVGDWGGGDFADLMMGVDEALGRFPFIDGERLGVIGASYGGFMTSWVVSHTDRFKTACSEAGISNVATQVGTSDIGWHWTIDEQGGGIPIMAMTASVMTVDRQRIRDAGFERIRASHSR